MAIKGKIKVQLYLDPEKVNIVRDFLDSSRNMPGWSEFMNIMVTDFADRIEEMDEEGTIEELIQEWKIHD